MQTETFETWLAAHAEPVPRARGALDRQPGVVMAWRDAHGVLAHAAVTLGDGWLLQKASQGWMSPTTVLPVRQGMLAARTPGFTVHRYRMG